MDDDDDGDGQQRDLKNGLKRMRLFCTYIERLKRNRASDRWHSGYHVFELVSVHFIAPILLLHFNI